MKKQKHLGKNWKPMTWEIMRLIMEKGLKTIHFPVVIVEDPRQPVLKKKKK